MGSLLIEMKAQVGVFVLANKHEAEKLVLVSSKRRIVLNAGPTFGSILNQSISRSERSLFLSIWGCESMYSSGLKDISWSPSKISSMVGGASHDSNRRARYLPLIIGGSGIYR